MLFSLLQVINKILDNCVVEMNGMVFGEDGYLYYVVSEDDFTRRLGCRMYLMRLNPETGEKEEIGALDDGQWATFILPIPTTARPDSTSIGRKPVNANGSTTFQKSETGGNSPWQSIKNF